MRRELVSICFLKTQAKGRNGSQPSEWTRKIQTLCVFVGSILTQKTSLPAVSIIKNVTWTLFNWFIQSLWHVICTVKCVVLFWSFGVMGCYFVYPTVLFQMSLYPDKETVPYVVPSPNLPKRQHDRVLTSDVADKRPARAGRVAKRVRSQGLSSVVCTNLNQ